MTYLLDFDQQSRLEQDEAFGAIYLKGVGDDFDGRLPAMAEVPYIQGYCAGMKQVETTNLSISRAYLTVSENQTEYPLFCHQCAHFDDGMCRLKFISRNSNSYACNRVVIDCLF